MKLLPILKATVFVLTICIILATAFVVMKLAEKKGKDNQELITLRTVSLRLDSVLENTFACGDDVCIILRLPDNKLEVIRVR